MRKVIFMFSGLMVFGFEGKWRKEGEGRRAVMYLVAGMRCWGTLCELLRPSLKDKRTWGANGLWKS